jgi:hypothetical protein
MPLPHMHDRSTEALRIRSEASYISRLNGDPDRTSNGEEQEYRDANGRGIVSVITAIALEPLL